MDHNQFLFESVIGFPSQLLLENADGNQDGTVLLSSTNQSQISNQNMVEMGKKLLEAASENNVDAVRSLMSGGAPFTGNWLGTTPLHAAAKAGHIETVELLLKAGIFRDAKTKVERTALQMAAEEGHTTIVQMLLQYGADVNAKDMLKMTALHWAVERCHKDSVSLLLAHGADITAVNKFDKNPLDIAFDNGVGEIVKLIEEASSGSCHGEAQSTISETKIATEKLENELRQDTSKEEWKTSPEEDALEKLTANARNSSSPEAVKLLESHGISFLPTDNSTMLTSALESGQNIGLTEAGKMALRHIQTSTPTVKTIPQSTLTKKPKVVAPQSNGTGLPRVVTLTADQLLALATKLQAKGSNKPVFITLPKSVGLPVQGKLPVNRCAKPTIAPAILKKPAQPRVSSLSEFLAAKSIPNLQKPAPNPIREVQPLLSMPNLTDDAYSEPSASERMNSVNPETIIPDAITLGFDQIVHTTPSEETIETSVVTSAPIEVSSQQGNLLSETDLSSHTKPMELDKKMYFLKSGLLKGSARTTPMTLLWKRKRKHSAVDEDLPDTEVTASVAMTPVETPSVRHQPTLNNAAAPLDADDDMFINDESGSGHGQNPPVWLSIMDDNQFSAENDDDLLDPAKLAAQLASIRQAASQYSFSS